SLRAVGTGALWFESGREPRVVSLAPADDAEGQAAAFGGPVAGESADAGAGLVLKRFPLNAATAAAVRDLLPNLRPVPLGMATSAGFGDRLGMATPGHVEAL